MTEAEIKAAVEVIAAYDMRHADTLAKCKELAVKVLEAAEKVRNGKKP